METKTIFISIIGHTNAGKSSILNRIIGEKVAAISPKPQTTRTKVTGILTKNFIQYVYIDTPGLHKPTTKLSDKMIKSINSSLKGTDLILFVFDVTKKINENDLRFLQKITKPVILVLNKTDLLKDKREILPLISEFSGLYNFVTVIPTSVVAGDGFDVLMGECSKYAKDSPYYFPEEKFTDQSENTLIAEFVREKLLIFLKDEIPHGVAVVVEQAKEKKEIFHIDTTIYCERDNHKAIIIGKNGEMLKKISTQARAELEKFFNIQVNLKCWVKVKENWRNNDGIMYNLGFRKED